MWYKAAIPIVSGLAVELPDHSIVTVWPPSPTGQVYANLRVHAPADTLAWVPEPSWLYWLGQQVPPGQELYFEKRPARSDFYYRAANRGKETTVYVDEHETPESVKWLLLHEMTHANISAAPQLAAVIRSKPKPANYKTDDDAHESVWEEQIANGCADWIGARIGVPSGLNRRWWRQRVKSNYGQSELVLPSASAAMNFWRGEPGAVWGIAKTAAQRAGIIGLGLAVVGERKNLVKYSVAASLAIEAWVLWEAKRQMQNAPVETEAS